MEEITIRYLYQQYKDDVYSYLISLTHNKALSEDLTSETFLGAIKTLSSYKGNSSIKTWLFSIARYKWYEYLRKIKKELTQDDLTEVYACFEINLEAKIISKELIERIHKLLSEENSPKREVVLMRIEGYSFYEISKKYNISESSARVIDFRIRNKIKTILLKEGYSYE